MCPQIAAPLRIFWLGASPLGMASAWHPIITHCVFIIRFYYFSMIVLCIVEKGPQVSISCDKYIFILFELAGEQKQTGTQANVNPHNSFLFTLDNYSPPLRSMCCLQEEVCLDM
jgi:hypothetical protein